MCKQLLNDREAAAYLGISRKTFYWIAGNVKNFPPKITRQHRSRIQIDNWLATAEALPDLAKQARNIISLPLEEERIITKGW